jgi:hypothetical protein
MSYVPRPAGPKNIREFFHYLWGELKAIQTEMETIAPGGGPTEHDDLGGVSPDQHHNQVHLLYGPDQSDVDTTNTLETGSTLVFVAAADGGSDEFEGRNIFIARGYGGIRQSVPIASPDLDATFQVIPADAAVVTIPANVIQDTANNGLNLLLEGVWQVNILISFAHVESQQGRAIQFQIYNATTGAPGGKTTVPIARNQPGTFLSAGVLMEVSDIAAGDLFQIRVGGGDAVTGITMNSYQFSVSHVSEFTNT